ncbi:MAG: hypothetical protein ACKOCC_09150 [Actinomycetota bacterium]
MHIEPWVDPVVEGLGHPTESLYCETFWLPVLGPTAMWLTRMLARDLETNPGGFDTDAASIAARLGISWSTTKPSTLSRALARCEMFGACRTSADGSTIAVRRALAPLPRRHLARMPAILRDHHDAWSTRR